MAAVLERRDFKDEDARDKRGHDAGNGRVRLDRPAGEIREFALGGRTD